MPRSLARACTVSAPGVVMVSDPRKGATIGNYVAIAVHWEPSGPAIGLEQRFPGAANPPDGVYVPRRMLLALVRAMVAVLPAEERAQLHREAVASRLVSEVLAEART